MFDNRRDTNRDEANLGRPEKGLRKIFEDIETAHRTGVISDGERASLFASTDRGELAKLSSKLARFGQQVEAVFEGSAEFLRSSSSFVSCPEDSIKQSKETFLMKLRDLPLAQRVTSGPTRISFQTRACTTKK